ncbi:MAG: OmpA family protein [Limnothrix sp. RL_2_0]|nr:OmpA family protein [Limnothrix sp. RL_2_0]
MAASTLPSLELSNNIVIVDPLLDPSLLDDEINNILNPLNAVNGIQVTHKLDGDRLSLDGTVIQEADINTIISALEKISGINQITNNIQVQSQPITTRLYFDQNSAAIKPDDVDQKLNHVKEFLQQHPNLNLRIIGYQHPSESANDVALKRAQSTQILLEDQGIDRRRIIALGINQSPPNITAEDPIWLSRTIIFEIPEPISNTTNTTVNNSEKTP